MIYVTRLKQKNRETAKLNNTETKKTDASEGILS